MLEANNPEIDVDELMQKIREEVAKRHDYSQPLDSTHGAVASPVMDVSYIEALIKNAESRAYIRTKWPDRFSRFPLNLTQKLQKVAFKILALLFKDQREVNFGLIQSLRETVKINQQLNEQITTLQFQINERLDAVDSHLQRLDERLDAVDSRFQRLDASLDATDSRFQKLDEHLDTMDSRFQRIDERLDAADSRFQKLDEHYLRNDNFLKNDLAQQKRLIALFLEEARQQLPESFNQEQLQTFVREDQHRLDAFYTAFEDQFRGSRDTIRDRLKVYLPLLEEAKVGTPEFPILDVGCGRGEWLELLRESGYTVRGLDLNRVMVDYCRAIELDVVEGDVISYLQTLPDLSLGAVTGFHIVEHLPFPILHQFLSEVVRVLKPGGLAIFETPNPKNLVVGACNFYSDPTHKRPVFPETIQFIVESQGLSHVQLLYLNPVEGSPFAKDDAGSQQLHNWFFGPRDYAVIGRKL